MSNEEQQLAREQGFIKLAKLTDRNLVYIIGCIISATAVVTLCWANLNNTLQENTRLTLELQAKIEKRDSEDSKIQALNQDTFIKIKQDIATNKMQIDLILGLNGFKR